MRMTWKFRRVGSSETHEVVEPHALEGLNYDQSVHIKVLEGRPSDINLEVFNMIPPHLQWAITTVELFWTDGWASYSAKSSAKAELNVARALAAWSLVNKERTTWLQGSLNESKQELKIISEERDKLKTDLETVESDVANFFKRCDYSLRAQELTAKALEEAT
ncbi:hypothetical protein Fot_05647 [Forsythia ovata]|uniref:Uncharacterized protein n=1 Tax=Forsythia ovata TaxID=205694 RepID=A0ABD1WQS7_9LAMI